jgi:hypothetical protein
MSDRDGDETETVVTNQKEEETLISISRIAFPDSE